MYGTRTGSRREMLAKQRRTALPGWVTVEAESVELSSMRPNNPACDG